MKFRGWTAAVLAGAIAVWGGIGWSGSAQAQEVHVVNVYQGDLQGKQREFRQHPQGQVNVRVSVSRKPIVLVLAAYEPVNLVLALDSGAQVQRILVSRYHRQAVTGAGKIPVSIEDYESSKNESEIPPYADTPAEAAEMSSAIKKATGLSPASIQREYVGKSFVVDGKRGKR